VSLGRLDQPLDHSLHGSVHSSDTSFVRFSPIVMNV
jgi:hypothetical protein